MDVKPHRRAHARELRDRTAENENTPAAGPSSLEHHLIEFPLTEEPQDSACPQAGRPVFNRHCSLAVSPSKKDADENSKPILSRSVLDRRTSLPVLGIDLGRSGPSYGHTLKRSTVALYGLATEVFDPSPAVPLPDAPRGRIHSEALPMADERRSPLLSSTQWSINRQKKREERSREPSTNAPSPVFSAPPTFDRSDLFLDRPHRSSTAIRKPNFKPPTLPRSQTIGFSGLNSMNVQRQKKSLSRGANVNLKTHFRMRTAENITFDTPLSPVKDEISITDIKCPAELEGQQSTSTQESVSNHLRRVRKKRLIVRELVETERRYVAVLDKINQNYLKPIQQTHRREESAFSPRSSRYSSAVSLRAPNSAFSALTPSSLSINTVIPKEILPISTTADIFSNFDAILQLAHEFLKALEVISTKSRLFDTDLNHEPSSNASDADNQRRRNAERDLLMLSTEEELSVGKNLSRFWPYFKMYTVFTTNFAVSQSKLHIHSTKPSPSPEFVKLVSDCSRRGVDNGLGLPHMLLEIIQRVPRYELFFKDLIKHSDERFDLDFPYLVSSRDTLSSVARQLEAAMQDQEERTKILGIQRSMEGLNFPLVNPTRKLVKVGLLNKLGRRGELRTRIFFLFNDCLIYAGLLNYYSQEGLDTWIKWLGVKNSVSRTNKTHPHLIPIQPTVKSISSPFSPFGNGEENTTRLLYCLKMDLDDLNVVGTAIGKGADGKAFQILSSAKSFVVFAESHQIKEEWITALRQAKQDMFDKRGTLFITEESRHPEIQRRPRIPNHHPNSSSPPLRVVSWVSFSSSDGTGSSAPADGSERGISSPTSSAPAGSGGIGSQRMQYEARRLKNPPGVVSPRTQSLASSVISLWNFKSLVNRRHLVTPVPTEVVQTSSQNQDNDRLESQDLVSTQDTSDDNFIFVAENYSAPVWVPDNRASRCMACQERFSLLRRRHHCRLCGCVFCATCSSRTFIIVNRHVGDRYARACEACYKSVFVVPHSLSLANQEQRRSPRLQPNHPRPSDDADLAFHEQRLKQATATHRHRQSLPLELNAIVSEQLRRCVTDPRSSLFSATTVEEDGTTVSDNRPSQSVTDSCQSIPTPSVPLEGARTKAGKHLSRLLHQNV